MLSSSLNRGLEIVGENALLLSVMAYAEWQYFNSGIDPDERRLERAAELAERALALEPDSPFARKVLGLRAISSSQPLTAITELRRSHAVDPNDTDAAILAALGLTGTAPASSTFIPIFWRVRVGSTRRGA